MFFEDLFREIITDEETWIPIIASIDEEETEIDFDKMTDKEIRRYNEHLGKL